MTEKAIFKARFNALQVIFMVGSIVFFIIMNTKAFTEFSDWVKVSIYAAFVITVAIAGVSPGSIKDLLEKAKAIFDKDLDPEEKIAALMSIMTTVAAQLGIYWEKLNESQGIIHHIAEKIKTISSKPPEVKPELIKEYHINTTSDWVKTDDDLRGNI